MRAALKRVGLILLVCAGLLVTGCGKSSDDSTAGGDSTSPTTEATTAEKSPQRKKPNGVPHSGPPPKQLVKKDLILGTGAEAKSGDELIVEYVGVGYKTGHEFDTSWDSKEPYAIDLGAGEVLKGLDRGLEGMKVGGRRELIIPPDLAYGSQGGATIAPNSTLVFLVDLLAVE